MILIKHLETDEIQCVENAEGYSGDEWVVIGDIGELDPTLVVHDGDQIVEDLAPLQNIRSAEANAYRDTRIDLGCTLSTGGVIDADDVSRTNINGACLMATLAKAANQPFAMAWRMHDNTVQTFDADQMIQVGVEVGGFINQCYQASFAVKALIQQAATRDALDQVDVTAGYP